MKAWWLSLVALTVGCGGGAEEAPTTQVEAMVVRTVDWNPAKADLGAVQAVADSGDTSYLFGGKGVTLMTGGAARAQIAGPTAWVGAAAIVGADGTGTWVVGVTEAGRVVRVRASSSLEDVGERWGLEKDVVKSVVAVDDTHVAFGVAGGFALSDGKKVTRYDGPKTGLLRGGRGKLGFVDGGKVRVISLPAVTAVDWPLPTAIDVAIDARGILVTSSEGLFVERDGNLVQKLDGSFGPLTVAGDTTWTTTGGELVTSATTGFAKSTGAGLEGGAKFFGAPNGELWVVGTQVRRVSYGTQSAALADWQSTVQPIFAKVCSACHSPGGSAGLDLSSYAAWVRLRVQIEKQVVTDKSMPPKSAPFTDADRATVAAWITRNR